MTSEDGPEVLPEMEVERARRAFLLARGWRALPDGQWRHPRMELPWPVGYAALLEYDADRGDSEALLLLERAP